MALSSLAAYGDSDSEESTHEDEKDTHKKVDVQTKELMTLRRTKETAKRAGTVQITLPQITKRDDSSDEENEGGNKGTTVKKKSLIKSGTGLTSLLPQPKRFQGTKRTTSLIPPSIKKLKQTSSITTDTSDDYSNIQFFSNLDNSEPTPVSPEPTLSTTINKTTGLTSLPRPSLTGLSSNTDLSNITTHNATSTNGTRSQQPYSYHTCSYDNIQNPQYPSVTNNQYEYTPLNNPDSITGQTSNEPDTDERLKVDETSLYRLAGGGSKRGRKRGLEEESLMNIKDISENEIKDAVAYQKYLSQDHSHTSGTVPEDLAFSSTQKRKHQIHWLAAQAKAKEQELKNFWSQAAATRKQTQMKYGF